MRAADSISSAVAFGRAFLRPERIDRLQRAAVAMALHGPTIAGVVAASAARYPKAIAVVDDDGETTYSQLWRGAGGVARTLRQHGIGPGSVVGVSAHNSAFFLIAMVATAATGADIVYLNTGFSSAQLGEVVDSEGIGLILVGDDLAETATAAIVGRSTTIVIEKQLLGVLRSGSFVPELASRHVGRQVILTSGTTGRPKGAGRSSASGSGAAGLLRRIPYRARQTVVIPSPLFHAWGIANAGLALAMSSTIVLQRRFDPSTVLAAVALHRADGLVVVPVMLQRMLAVDDEQLARYDTTSLKYIAASGSAIGAPLVTAVLRRFGPVLHNVYGSTEVSMATIADPADLAADPSTAGKPVPGVTVRILDDHGRAVPTGTTGRIFVGSANRFDGYTGGGTKEEIDGLLSTGDVGHFDTAGRLVVEGRDDDMIISGGENVYPGEVEDVLAAYPGVAEVAVIGVPDDTFGQRLVAYVATDGRRTLTDKELAAHVAGRLARFKVPRDFIFVDELPRTTTGKIRRRDLKE